MDNNINRYSVDLSKVVNQIKELRSEEDKLKKQQDALSKAFKDGKISEEQYTKATKQLSNQLQNVKQRITATSDAMKKQLNSAMKDSLNNADGLGKAFQGVSNILQGNVLGAIGQLKGAFGALGGPMGIVLTAVTTLLAKLLPFREMADAISDTFSRWGSDLKGFLSISNEIERASDATFTFAERLELAQRQMDRLKKTAQETADAMSATSSFRSSLIGDEVSQYNKNGSLQNLERAVELQRAIYENEKKSAEENFKAKQAELERATIAKESLEIRQKIIAEIEQMRKDYDQISDVEGRTEQYRNQLIKDRLQLLDEEKKKEQDKAKLAQQAIDKDKAEREKAIRAIEDIEIQLIEDENARQLAQIELNKERALKAIDEIYSTASTETKKQLDIQKEAINTLAEYQASKVGYGNDVFKLNPTEVDKNLERQVELLKKHLSGVKQIQAESGNSLKAIEDERINALKREEEAYEKLIDQIKKAKISEEDRIKQTETAQRQHAINMENLTTNAELKKEQLALETNERIKQSNAQMLQSWASVGGSISSILGTLANQQEENSKSAMNLQKASIYISMAEAMARGMSSASSQPYPLNLVAIASTIAEMVAYFAQIQSMTSKAKYADGGLVRGKGNGKSDSIDAKLSNGEYVINADSTKANLPLLNALNYGNVDFTKSLITALKAMPNPIVSIESIDRQNVKYNNTKIFSHL